MWRCPRRRSGAEWGRFSTGATVGRLKLSQQLSEDTNAIRISHREDKNRIQCIRAGSSRLRRDWQDKAATPASDTRSGPDPSKEHDGRWRTNTQAGVQIRIRRSAAGFVNL